MPVVDITKLRDIDIKILKATGCEFVPVSDDYFVLSLNGRTFYAIPINK